MIRVPAIYILLVLGIFTLAVFYRVGPSNSEAGTLNIGAQPAANSTLGFGALYVVSGPGSSRRDGLIQSANVTGLDLTIPDLPAWTESQVSSFYLDEAERGKIKNGSVRAWLSHHLVLRDFVKSGRETALIFEDDVDWDIRIRTSQVPRAAVTLRSLLPPADEEFYWGHPDDWELLYLGHCGDYFSDVDRDGWAGVGIVHPEDLDAVPHAVYSDPTLPDRTDLHPFTSSLLSAFNVPEHARVVHKSKFPLCSFGYAVTRTTAKRIIEELAPPKENNVKHTPAYDIAILEACRDKGLRCYTINPELFHHMEGQSMIDGVAKDNAAKPPADRVGTNQVHYRKETSNIGCGFWSQDFRFDGDKTRLAYLREEVGRKGRCLKDGREDDGSRSRPGKISIKT